MITISQLKKYVSAEQAQRDKEFALHNALKSFNEDNMLMCVSSDLSANYKELVHSFLIKSQIDWLEWWMWETDFGKGSYDFSIGQKDYSSKDMYFDEFWKLIND